MITQSLSTLSTLNVSPIYGMATALTALATSLGLVAASGGLALPILTGLNELGIAGVPVGGTTTATTTTQTTAGGSTNVAGLIEEVKKLTTAIMGEELIVNIDGREIARGMRKFLKNN
jgi:ABC-type phosphate transport system substrate-binding protein